MMKIEVGRCKDCKHWGGCPDYDDGYMVCRMTGSKIFLIRDKIKNALSEFKDFKNPDCIIPGSEFDSWDDYIEKMPINIENQTLAYCEEPNTYLATSPYFGCVMFEIKQEIKE